MREANGRDPETGRGDGNDSWIGLALGMIVVDSLSGPEGKGTVTERWRSLLLSHDVPADDASIIYELRCSLLHGYGLPSHRVISGRRFIATGERAAYALDTSDAGIARLSVPVFCARLVERIAFEAPYDWDTTLIDTEYV
jgi:hypothetical protein